MKVFVKSRYRGRYKEQAISLEAGEHDLDPALVAYLRSDSPALISRVDHEEIPVKEILAPPVDKMTRKSGMTTKNTFQRG